MQPNQRNVRTVEKSNQPAKPKKKVKKPYVILWRYTDEYWQTIQESDWRKQFLVHKDNEWRRCRRYATVDQRKAAMIQFSKSRQVTDNRHEYKTHDEE